MTKIQLLENAIQKLDRDGLAQFRDWFRRYDAAAWDRQLERDAKAGKLAGAAAEAIATYKAGKTRAL